MTQPPIGQIPERANIVNITNSLPCQVFTDGPHEFQNKSFVRITDLNGSMPISRGEDELNNSKFRIIVSGEDSFYLQNPITFNWIDSTEFPPYVTGGSCNLVQPNFVFYPSSDQVFPN